MPRPIQVSIDTAALSHNLAVVRHHAPQTRVMAVIKANAYGHGLLKTADALKNADGFALLELDAAIRLRDTGYHHPILLLEGFFSMKDLALFEQYQLSTVIHHSEQIAMLAASSARLNVFLKINTGMNRLGFMPEQFHVAVKQLTSSSAVNQLTLMTHFADSDGPLENDSFTHQFECFNALAKTLRLPRSLANSAAIFRYPQTHAEWVRPGIMLYGCSPFSDKTAKDLNLRPVMTLTSRVIATHELKCGDKVGYGGLFQADRPMRIGIVACGYADGYPRHAPTNTPILINDQRSRLLGRVSMDMLAVDLTDIKSAQVNSPVTLWGEGISVDEVAHAAESISYELLCAVAPRVERI